MPRRRKYDKYPAPFFALFTKAWQEPVRIVCATNSQAESLRRELYTFRQVLYANSKRNPSVAERSRQCAILVRGCHVIVHKRQVTKDERLARALEK